MIIIHKTSFKINIILHKSTGGGGGGGRGDGSFKLTEWGHDTPKGLNTPQSM